MKKLSRLLSLVMVAAILLLAMPMTAHGIEVEPGETYTVRFSYSNIYGIDGNIKFSNRDMLSSVSYDTSKSNLGGSIANDLVYMYGANEVSGSIGVVVKVSPNAKPGDSCTITFNYETSDMDGNMSGFKTSSATITVKEPATEPSTDPTKPTNTKPTDSTKPTNSTKPTTPTETTTPTAQSVDYTELKRQIAIAEGLNSGDYTSDSWDVVELALAKAKVLLYSESQAEVDAGAKELEEAIAKLVRFDTSRLQAAIQEARALQNEQPLGGLWESLLRELENGANLLDSGDQEAVDQCADRIHSLLEEIRKEIEKLKVVEKVTEIQKVEVEPQGDYCNIRIHYVWPVLFFISAALNVLFIVAVIVFVSKRKKNQKDDTPLVDYDIDDDVT